MRDSRCGLYVETEERGNKTFVMLAGELDISNVDVLVTALASIRSAHHSSVVIDIGQLDFLGACGMNAIALAALRLARNGCPLLIAGANPCALRSLRATGLGSLLVSTSENTVIPWTRMQREDVPEASQPGREVLRSLRTAS